jgi:hypothetical protein
MNWEYKSIPVKGLLTFNNTMQLFIKTSDLEPNANITEAAFDYFRVTNFSTNELNELVIEPKIYPNPILENLQIENVKLGDQIVVFDQKGSVLLDAIVKENQEVISFQKFEPGIYFVKIGSKFFKVLKVNL